MTEPSAQTQPSSTDKSRKGPLAVVLTLILVAGGIGAFAWRSSESPATEAVAQSPARPAPQTAPPEQSTASINALKESVAGLDASRKQVSDEVADLKRQLATEQGERKMLAEQLGSLSNRVDSLAASAAPRADTVASEPSQKKRAKSR
ncbi:gas vesicle protein [Bradyrhizobium sp. GM5.1]